MLSDRWRPLVAAACVAGLVLCFGWWAWLHHSGTLGYGDFVDAPGRRDGEQVALSLVRVAEVDSADRYHVEKGTLRIAVQGASAGLVVGEDISVGGQWDAASRTLRQEWIERREEGRSAKRVLGVTGIFVVGLLLARRIRPSREGLVLLG